MTADARVRAATAFEELAFFALSYVHVMHDADVETRAARLFRTNHASHTEAARPFEDDRLALQALAGSGLLFAQSLPRLFASARDLRATLRRAAQVPFAELASHEGIRQDAHAAMGRGDTRLAELLLCDMALAADAFLRDVAEGSFATTAAQVPQVEGALVALRALAPCVGEVDVVVCAALGFCGRVFPSAARTLIYLGVAPEDLILSAREAALLVLHEIAVTAANGPYASAERAAISAVTELVRGSDFEADHGRRLARFDLASLADEHETRVRTARVLHALRDEKQA